MRSAETNGVKTIVFRTASCGRAPFRRFAAAALALTLGAAGSVAPALAAPLRGGRSGDDLRETITLLMMVRMKNELGLSTQQYEQVLPKVEGRERSRQANFRSRRERLGKLRAALAREGAKDAELSDAVEAILALDEADHRQDESFVSDMRKILSPRQQAQLLLFRQRFRQWVEGRMRDAQELRRRYGRRSLAGRGGTGGAAPSDEGDDGGNDSGPDVPDRP